MLEEDDGGSDEPDYKPKALVYSQWDTELVLVSKVRLRVPFFADGAGCAVLNIPCICMLLPWDVGTRRC